MDSVLHEEFEPARVESTKKSWARRGGVVVDEADRRAKLRERLEREAAAAEHSAPVPGRTTLVEQQFNPRAPTRAGVPGRATLAGQQSGIDAQQLLTQARQALAGAGDRDGAYDALVNALAVHGGALPPEQAGAMMEACINLLQSRRSPAAIAARGVAGASSALPFHDEIQASFGRHDISGVRAQVGGEAAAASGAIGARAYATGNRVAFAGTPDLHTAAHEAAHVVQQRGGVQLKGIDGGSGDSHEHHADAVADAVVRGESAEQLLDQKTSGAAAIQRKEGDAPLPRDKLSAKMDNDLFTAEHAGESIPAVGFVHLHIAELRQDIDVFLMSRNLAPGVPEVHFAPDIGPFMNALFSGFDKEPDHAAKVKRLRTWVAPDDLYQIVDRNRAILEGDKKQKAWSGNPNEGLDYGRGPKGPPQYNNAVAVGIGSVLEERLLSSLKRMSAQLVAATARHRAAGKDKPVEAHELVPSHPLDWEVVLAMVGRGDPTVMVADGKLSADATATPVYKKITRVEWQGPIGGPWNAVRVEPSDAGTEAVAQKLLGQSTEAYRIQRVGPYFLIPEDQAIQFPQAMLFRKTEGDVVQGLAYGKNAGAVEKAEAERAVPVDAKAPSPAELNKQWSAIRDQLLGISAVVRPYGLDAELGLALSRHATHKFDLPTLSGHDAAVRAALFTKQADLLLRVGSQVSSLTKSAPFPKPGPGFKPLYDMLAKLVRVANLSHLPETGEAALAEVGTEQRASLTDSLEAALGDIATQIEIARVTGTQASQAKHRSQGTYGESLAERADKLRQRVAVFKSELSRDKASTSELDAIMRDVDALRFEAGIIAEVGQLGQLFQVLDELEDSNWVLFSEGITSSIDEVSADNRIGRLETARRGSMDLRRELNIIHGEWLTVEKDAQAIEANLVKGGVKDADAAARAMVQPRIALIQAKLKKLGGEKSIQTFLEDAYSKVKSAQRRAMIVQIATMIGVAALASATGGLGAGIAEGLGGSALTASVVSVVAETTMFTAVSARLNGEPVVAAFINNGIGNLLTFGAMKGVGSLLEGTSVGWTLAMAKNGAKVSKAALIAAKAASFTAEALVATGIQIAQAEYESMRKSGHAMSRDELEMTAAQGIAMLIGTAISHRVLGDPAMGTHALGTKLGGRVKQIRAMSDNIAVGGHPTEAIALMEQTRALLKEIGDHARELSGKSDHELGQLGYTRHEVEALAKYAGEQTKQLDSMDAGTLAAQLGLHPVVPGRVFSGGPREVDAVVSDFKSRGYSVEKSDQGFRVSKKDEAPIELFVRTSEERSTGSNRTQEANARQRARASGAESRAADAVPGSSFTPDATPGEVRARFHPADLHRAADAAVTILGGAKGGDFAMLDGRAVLINAGRKWVRIDLDIAEPGETGSAVAIHSYETGKNRAHILVAEHARPEDLVRAVAHELSEIHALMVDEGRKTTDPPALTPGSASEDLNHHDIGRKAELQILLYELKNDPSRRADILHEIQALMTHLGFELKAIALDQRARKLLGNDTVKTLAELTSRKRIVLDLDSGSVKPDSRINGPEWVFTLDVVLPNGEKKLAATGTALLGGDGRPESGPSFYIDKRVDADGEPSRVDFVRAGKPVGLTEYVITEASKRFEQKFGHPPTELPGSLADDNREIFQRAYLKAIDEGMPPEQAADHAAQQTPYVRNRKRLGFTDVSVAPSRIIDKIVYGMPPRVREVPHGADIVARKP